MPANGFEDSEIWAIIAYLRSLAPPKNPVISGDRAKGEKIFWEAANCGRCHMVKGRGGLLGPDLSRIGAARSTAYLTDSIRDPDKDLSVGQFDPNNHYGFDMPLPANEQHLGELYNLSVRRGTLTEEDRFKINDHIVQTLIMLRRLPWPAQLARVPDIAATHHEKMDGKGYPRKLGADQLTVVDRVMALADIFEALTAADRPYKAAKTLTESLRIMAFMAKDQHIDADLFRYFLHSRLWREFAEQYMQAGQMDDVDIAALEKLLPGVAQAA